jgi:outer membrane biogenesis lipoprotein LolB
MRTKITLALLLTALLSACTGCASSGPGPWQKPGANEQTVVQDDAECHEAAQEEALRRYPYRAGSPTLGASGTLMTQQHDDNNRAIAEASFFNNCLRGRGYQPATSGK